MNGEDLLKYIIGRLGYASSEEIAQLTGMYPSYEQATWDNQAKEAEAWNDWNNNLDPDKPAAPPTPTLDGIALHRGISLEVLVGKVLENATVFKDSLYKIIGKRQALTEQAETAYLNNDIETLKSIKWVSPL